MAEAEAVGVEVRVPMTALALTATSRATSWLIVCWMSRSMSWHAQQPPLLLLLFPLLLEVDQSFPSFGPPNQPSCAA